MAVGFPVNPAYFPYINPLHLTISITISLPPNLCPNPQISANPA
ncbi:putative formin-like protein 16 [Iris pallida]|uniref:Formin-like protein 16 n=1 Tax=Iris pallida TaxID=29817 RepID=A0AAX6DXI4_IRIPA|nr:putative formin-like protein 16 [Iris pallida]